MDIDQLKMKIKYYRKFMAPFTCLILADLSGRGSMRLLAISEFFSGAFC